jgi:hypothetical protein
MIEKRDVLKVGGVVGLAALVLAGCNDIAVNYAIEQADLDNVHPEEFPVHEGAYTHDDLVAAANEAIAEKYVMSPGEFFARNPDATGAQYLDYLEKDMASMDKAQDKLRAIVFALSSDPAYASQSAELRSLLKQLTFSNNIFGYDNAKSLLPLYSLENPTRDQLEYAFHMAEGLQNDAAETGRKISRGFNVTSKSFPILSAIDELAEQAKRIQVPHK